MGFFSPFWTSEPAFCYNKFTQNWIFSPFYYSGGFTEGSDVTQCWKNGSLQDSNIKKISIKHLHAAHTVIQVSLESLIRLETATLVPCFYSKYPLSPSSQETHLLELPWVWQVSLQFSTRLHALHLDTCAPSAATGTRRAVLLFINFFFSFLLHLSVNAHSRCDSQLLSESRAADRRSLRMRLLRRNDLHKCELVSERRTETSGPNMLRQPLSWNWTDVFHFLQTVFAAYASRRQVQRSASQKRAGKTE